MNDFTEFFEKKRRIPHVSYPLLTVGQNFLLSAVVIIYRRDCYSYTYKFIATRYRSGERCFS